MVLLLWIICVICVMFLSFFCVYSSLLCDAGKGLTSWLSFVIFYYFCHFPMWYPGSGVVFDCFDSWSLPSFLLSSCFYHCFLQLIMKFHLLRKQKLWKIITLLAFKLSVVFIMLINVTNANNRWHFDIYGNNKFHAQLIWVWFFYNFKVRFSLISINVWRLNDWSWSVGYKLQADDSSVYNLGCIGTSV